MMYSPMRQMCPQCGWRDTRPSHKTWVDEVLDRFWLDPFRCRSCNARFRRFRHQWAQIVTPMLAMSFLLLVAGSLVLLYHEREVWKQRGHAHASAPTPLP